MHQLTVICIQDIIGAALLVQAQRKRTILIFITKRKFHFVAVTEFDRASVDSFPFKIGPAFCIRLSALDQCILQKLPDLCFLHLKLILIRHGLIHTSATGRKITAHRLPCLLR